MRDSLLRDKLGKLVESKQLHSFSLEEQIKDLTGRYVDRLRLDFPSGETLEISTFCSGFSEDTCFMMEEQLGE